MLINLVYISRRGYVDPLARLPKPRMMTPSFQRLIFDQERHSETLGRVMQCLNFEEKVHLLNDLSKHSQMVYLRAGELVYGQRSSHDKYGNGMGIYYIARGQVSSVIVPGQINTVRQREEAHHLSAS